MASMVRQRAGSIIFIGSISPFVGVPGQANYAAAKAGLVGLARALAKEVASRGITVNVVAPGLIDTDMTSDLGVAKDAMAAMIPMDRIGQPSDIAGVVGFLASNEARYITGAVIAVDGGLAMGL
jgi:beta-ketoacyl ACP reductase